MQLFSIYRYVQQGNHQVFETNFVYYQFERANLYSCRDFINQKNVKFMSQMFLSAMKDKIFVIVRPFKFFVFLRKLTIFKKKKKHLFSCLPSCEYYFLSTVSVRSCAQIPSPSILFDKTRLAKR